MESKITPDIAEKGNDALESTSSSNIRRPKQREKRSKLPGPLWILSFAPPFPRISRDPVGAITHPYTLYIIGILTALIAGVGLPAFDILYGYWTTGITDYSSTNDAIYARGQHAGWLMTVVAFVTLFSYIAFLSCCSLAGLKLANELRSAYFESILGQDVAFFDHVGAGEVAARSSKDISLIRVGFGERVGYITSNIAVMIAALVSSFIQSPKLAGILFALIPFTIIMFGLLGWWYRSKTLAQDQLEGTTSTAVEQLVSASRIVQSFGIGNRLLAKLESESFKPLRRFGMITASGKALEQTAAFFIIFIAYSLCFWAGSIVVAEGTEVGHVLTALFNMINVLFAFAMSIPHITGIIEANGALNAIRKQIERDPVIDITDTSGLELKDSQDWQPSFALDQVTFAYPTRPNVKALDAVTLECPAGKFTAIVGPSGSGKSTVASLLLREYDPETANLVRDIDIDIKQHFEQQDEASKKDDHKKHKKDHSDQPKSRADTPEGDRVQGAGRVTFAGHDLRALKLRWLRRQVAVVSQNPQLFAGSILDNVASGLSGTRLEYRPDSITTDLLVEIRERCEEALKKAQAWEFVRELANGIDEVILGGRTGVLSGGQLQRVALARAFVSRPRCLLLDEATSAVASDAELKITDILLEEQRTRGLTLIVVAHRLSSIAQADNIIVMTKGKVVNQGTYEQLIDPSNVEQTFLNMVNAKQSKAAKKPHQSEVATLTENEPISMKRQFDRSTSTPAEDLVTVLGPPLRKSKAIFGMNKWLLLVGTVSSALGGAAFVVSGWLTGSAVASLSIPNDNSRMRSEMNRWSLYFFILALGVLVLFFIGAWTLEWAGMEIKYGLKKESLRAILRQDTAFFETDQGGSGTLTSGVAEFPSAVGQTVGVIWLQIVVALANLVGSFVLGFVLSWRVAIIGFPAIFLAIVAGYFNFTWLEEFEALVTKEAEKRSNHISEAVNSIRTIASLTREGEVLRRFKAADARPRQQRLALLLGSVGFGIAQGSTFLFGAFVFWWGARLISRSEVTIKELFATTEAIMVAAMTSGRILTFVGDVSRTSNALKSIQKWLDLEPAHIRATETIRQASDSGSDPKTIPNDHTIAFRNVDLRYPSRPDALAICDLSLTFQPGVHYAFCGASGSGKSSVLALLQRFYEPTAGEITVGGIDIRSIDMDIVRGMMGYVSQEAVLFPGTIRFNLTLGAKDPENVSQEELEYACKQACILQFIQDLEKGFDTDLGITASQLSGGQRQRLCIARALLRKPKLLLLDEATSALDNESQAEIQEAMNLISARVHAPTIITVAHRLSTIRNADVIHVMESGGIVESGTHEELVEKNGRYWHLIESQV